MVSRDGHSLIEFSMMAKRSDGIHNARMIAIALKHCA